MANLRQPKNLRQPPIRFRSVLHDSEPAVGFFSIIREEYVDLKRELHVPVIGLLSTLHQQHCTLCIYIYECASALQCVCLATGMQQGQGRSVADGSFERLAQCLVDS